MLQQAVFYSFTGIALFAAYMVVAAKNPVRAVLSLVLVFFATAAIWITLEAEFLAMALILVYVGAVMVLFLFVVMMLDIDFATVRAGFTKYLPIGICLSVLIFVLLANIFNKYSISLKEMAEFVYYKDFSNVKMLGTLLFTRYTLHIEVAGILLLAAIIASIKLAGRGPQHRKMQSICKQVHVRSSDRVRLVDLTESEDKI